MGEEIGMIADSSTTPRISRKEECVPAGVVKMTAEVPVAGLIAVARPFIFASVMYLPTGMPGN